MSDEAFRHGAGDVPPARDPDRPSEGTVRKTRGRRAPTPAELVLLRWLAAKPRPVTMGPIGNCVKRGWCEPVRAVVEDDGGRRLSFIYVVTEAGSRLIEQHGRGEGAGSEDQGGGAREADRDGAGDAELGARSRSTAADRDRG